jgi:hypothetical protein
MANPTRRTTMRATTLAALTATAALALAGCGAGEGGGGDGAAATAGQAGDPQEAALRFARCMREQGIDFPDPTTGPNGMTRIKPPTGADEGDPRMEKARKACAKHLAQGAPQEVSDQERAEMQRAGLRFARCMREQGVEFPDPGADGQVLVDPSSGVDPSDPRFKRAEGACRDELPVLPGGRR